MKQQLAERVLAAAVVAWLALAAPVLAGGEPRTLAPPSPGEEVAVPVTPGAWFELSHPDFDPDRAV